MFKTIFNNWFKIEKQSHVWLATFAMAFILIELVMSGMSLIFHDVVIIDFLITGIVISILTTIIVGNMWLYFLRKLSTLRLDHSENASIMQAHDLLQTVIEAIPLRIFWKDTNLRYLGCNTVFANDAGQSSPEGIIGKLDSDIWEQHADNYQADDLSVIQSKQTKFSFVETQTTPEDKIIWIRTSKSPLIDNVTGDTIGVLGIYEDITKQREVENSLWLTQTFIDKSKTAFFDLNPSGKILSANNHACKVLDTTPNELLNMFAWDLTYDLDATDWADVWNRLKENGVVTFESKYQRKNEELHYIDITCHHIQHEKQEHIFCVVHNISDRKQAEQALQQKEAYQRALLDNFPFNVWLKDTNSCFLAVNQSLADNLGYPNKNSLIGKSDFDIATLDFAEQYRKDDIEVMESRQRKNVEELVEEVTRRIWVETYKAPAIDESGALLGTVGFSRDISERKEIETELQIAAIAFESQEGMIITDPNSVILKINQSFTRITGYSEEEALGQKMQLLTSGRHDRVFYTNMWAAINSTGSWQGEIWNRRKNGEVYPEWLTISAVKDKTGTVTHYVGTMIDITIRKAVEQEVQHLAHHDDLTDLPNRTLLTDRLNQALAQAQIQNKMLALMFMDLDKFKPVNDVLGHDIGDLLLKEVAKRLLNCMKRESDTVARIGGDEFVIVLTSIDLVSDIEIVAQRILDTLKQPFNILDHSINISSSIGIAIYPKQGIDGRTLMKNADYAMYQAKGSGRNRYTFFTEDNPVLENQTESNASKEDID